jgi:hypothetical protein
MESNAETEFVPGPCAELSAKKYPENLVVDTGCDGAALLEDKVLELNVLGKHRATPSVHFPGLAPQRPFAAKVPTKIQGSTGVLVIDAEGLVKVDFLFGDRPIRSNFETLLAGKCANGQLKAIAEKRVGLIWLLGRSQGWSQGRCRE